MSEFVGYIPMRLNDENLQPWDGTRSRVDPGTYDFEIERTAFDTSRKGNRTLVVTAKVVAPVESPMVNRNMRCSYVISDEDFARRRMLALIVACGAVLDEQGGFTAESLVGLQFTADVVADNFETIDDKTGQPVSREVTKWVGERPIEGGAVQAAAPAAEPARGTPPRRPAPPNGGQQARR